MQKNSVISQLPEQSTSSKSAGGGNLTPEEALEALQALTRLASDRGSRHRRRLRLQQYSGCEEGGGAGVGGGIAFSDSDDCDDSSPCPNPDEAASSVSSLSSVLSRCSSDGQRPLSPSAAVLMAAVLNSSSADASTRNFALAGNSNYGGARYASSSRHHRRKRQRRRAAGQQGCNLAYTFTLGGSCRKKPNI